MTTALAAMLLMSGCAPSPSDAGPDDTPMAQATATPTPTRSPIADVLATPPPTPAPGPLAVTPRQLHGPQLDALVDELTGTAVAAAGRQQHEVDGERLYMWGPGHRELAPEDDVHHRVWTRHPTFLSLQRDGAAWRTVRADDEDDDDFREQFWSADASTSFQTRLYEAPPEEPTDDREDVRTVHSMVSVDVEVHPDPAGAEGFMSWLVDSWYGDDPDGAHSTSYYTEPTRDTLAALDDARVEEELTATAGLAQTDDVAETLLLAEGLHEARRVLRSGNVVVTVTLDGTVSPDALDTMTADVATAVLDALGEPFTAGPTVDAATARGTPVTSLDAAVSRRTTALAGVTVDDLHGEDHYGFGAVRVPGDVISYRAEAPDMVVFPMESQLAADLLTEGYLRANAHTGGLLDARVYERVADDDNDALRGRVDLRLWSFDRVDDADLMFTHQASFSRDDQVLPPLTDSGLTEQLLVETVPSLAGSGENQDLAAEGLRQLVLYGRLGTTVLTVRVAGTEGLDLLRETTVELVDDVVWALRPR